MTGLPAKLSLCQYSRVFASQCPDFVFHLCVQTICKHHNDCDVPENNIPLLRKIFWFDPLPPSPSGNSNFCSYFLSGTIHFYEMGGGEGRWWVWGRGDQKKSSLKGGHLKNNKGKGGSRKIFSIGNT